jgi:transcriptional regulator with XRE-family HTH domain
MKTMNLKRIRLQRGLSMEVLAYKAGVSTRAIYMLERYGLPPKRRATLEKIARVLGVEPDELLSDAENSEMTHEV